jgi:MFS family permease
MVVARLDRIPIWSLPYLFVGVIGVGFLHTVFDIFDINVSYIETCTQIVHGCTPATAGQTLGIPVLINLLGYVVGTLALSPLADRFGRRDVLLITMAITGLGSLWTVFTQDLTTFTLARFVTGIGIGADLAIVNTYINEVAPVSGRARYTSVILFMSAMGAFFGIWLGLLFTTQATPFPLGLPFALAGRSFTIGWRIMYAIGALLALVGVLLRFQLPESPRWLVSRGRVEQANEVVTAMEERAYERVTLTEPEVLEPRMEQVDTGGSERTAFAAIFTSRLYLRRLVLLLVMWFFGYVTVYSYGAGFTTALASLNYPPPEAGLIAAFGTLGFIACTVVAYFLAERLERRRWLPIAAAITLAGSIVVGAGGKVPVLAFLGALIIFFGFNVWVPMTYSWTTENFPTRARTTGFGLADGIGHIGGGLGVLLLVPALPTLGAFWGLVVIALFLVLAAVVAQFGISTRGRRLAEVSP